MTIQNTAEEPLVSVAIISYNQESFIEECLDSVLSQDYPNLELVVADDGSQDRTAEIIRIYGERYPTKMRLIISDVNRGITQNSNAAHFACSGDYIAWLGGDDLMLEGKISRQVDFMESNPRCVLSYHDLEIFQSDTKATIGLKSKASTPFLGGIREIVRHGPFNGASSTMIRRSKAPSYGFDERLPIASDWLYWIETLSEGGQLGYIDEVLGRYRRHANNITSSTSRIPALKNTQDHLFTCEVVTTKWPWLEADVMYRRSRILLELRWLRDGADYDSYLRASFRSRPNLRALVGLGLSKVLRIKK